MDLRTYMSAALLALALTAPAGADEPRTPELRKPETHRPEVLKPDARVSMQAYGAANRTCAEWTNACVICRRDASGEGRCSTPGIACQPKEISCTRKD